jgi:hypothetical protein
MHLISNESLVRNHHEGRRSGVADRIERSERLEDKLHFTHHCPHKKSKPTTEISKDSRHFLFHHHKVSQEDGVEEGDLKNKIFIQNR